LQNLGYGWRVDGPDIPKIPVRFEPGEKEIIGSWLAPPSAGWTMPSVQVVPPRDSDTGNEDLPSL
ncbi:MAG: hypothetical protein ACRD96_17040, partial [Bryobacteraceae bacterium]